MGLLILFRISLKALSASTSSALSVYSAKGDIGVILFCLVLFIYLHINFHWKTGEDLEMYEVDQPSKDKLEEICDIRQPVLFDFENQKIMETSNKNYILNNYHQYNNYFYYSSLI